MSSRPKLIANVNRKICVACGTCVTQCPKSVIDVWRGSFAVVALAQCLGCGRCAAACPIGAITLRERVKSEGETL